MNTIKVKQAMSKRIILIAIAALLTVNVLGQNITEIGNNVGIGTTTPKAQLQIGNNISIESGSPGIGRNFYYDDGFKYIYDGFATQINPTSTGELKFRTAISGYEDNAITWNTNMIILNNGFVGIGMASPSRTLEIKNTKGVGSSFIAGYSANSNNRIFDIVESSDEKGYLRLYNSGDITVKIDANGNSYLNGGNVGVGTTNPDNIIEVAAIEYSSNRSGGIRLSDNGKNWFFDLNISTNSEGVPRFSINSHLSGEIFSIKSNGNVGIGTTTPPYKLSVEGTIGAREVIVTSDVWADFVFEPTYNLMPLKELNTYIQENKHLPEIPTTAEVQENGISVGEMNAKLLQKIEELTLHTIQQQELIEALLNRVEQIENK